MLVGRRRVGNQSLELMITGYASLDEADRAFAQRLPEMIHVEDGKRQKAENRKLRPES